MLELSINNKSAASITAAIKKIKEMITTGTIQKDTLIHLTLEPGVYRESVRYNLSNPLIMEGVHGAKPEDIVIQVENCESFNKGVENRGVFVVGPNATKVTLRNFSIINTHKKSVEGDVPLADAAEAFVWNNTTGFLRGDKLRMESCQNTLCVKGNALFTFCSIIGDSDVIYGDTPVCLFEHCKVHLKEDSRGDYDGFAVKSLSPANSKGFVFYKTHFTADERKKNIMFPYRTWGKGGPMVPKFWDNCAFIKCRFSERYSDELAWDDDMNLNLYPRGTALGGVREFGTKTIMNDGTVVKADTINRNVKTYTLTESDYYENYSSRYLILKNLKYAWD